VCVRPQASGGPCFPRQRQDVCPTGEVCAATDFSTGSCQTATAEANEPNGSPGKAGTPVSLPAAISGTLSPSITATATRSRSRRAGVRIVAPPDENFLLAAPSPA